jgi:hypothetical protein
MRAAVAADGAGDAGNADLLEEAEGFYRFIGLVHDLLV